MGKYIDIRRGEDAEEGEQKRKKWQINEKEREKRKVASERKLERIGEE